MVRHGFGILGISLLTLLTVGAGSPPNLGMTLAAQQVLVAERPYDAEVYNDLGNLLVLDDRRQEAQDAYRKAIELSPESALPRFNLGVLLQQDGRSKEAAAEFRGLLAIDERNARAHYQLGKLYEARKRRNAALEHYARAFAYDPELTFPRNNPHIIDNRLATEALLMSRRFHDSTPSDLPRLYGEPERIAGLMLDKKLPSPEAEAEATAESGSMPAAAGGEAVPTGPGSMKAHDGEENLGVELGESQEGAGEGRRALTRQDLDAGSSIGQAQPSGAAAKSRRSPAGTGARGAAASRTGVVTRQQLEPANPSSRPTTRGSTPATSDRPRYQPASRFSTGRLQLELLPPEPVEHLADRGSEPARG